jgi:GNAT superfamily N-acetyltransferase
MICRSAGVDDATALGVIHVDAWRAAYRGLMPDAFLSSLDADDARRRWERWLGAGATVRVVESGGRIVGFCTFGRSRDAGADPATGEVMAINVHPESWRKGVGRALLLEVTALLRADGFADATLWVVHGNERARRFYEVLGWRPDGGERVESGLTGSPLHEVRYRLSLRA